MRSFALRGGACAAVTFAFVSIAPQAAHAQPMKLSSPSFTEGQPMPDTHAYRKQNLSPELLVEHVPANARSLALAVDDPDAPVGTWNHWLVWNIDPTTAKIAQGDTPAGAMVGKNDFGNTRYDGPAPPSGVHRYFFKLYALDAPLTLRPGAARKDLEGAMRNHILATATLMGTYAHR
jgi:Raf kinase inhibitor-like YbhB/YbcL family protein